MRRHHLQLLFFRYTCRGLWVSGTRVAVCGFQVHLPWSVVFRYTCRGLFERHKLLFSFHMCAKILESSGKLNMDEYDFFLRGGIVSKTAC